MVHDDRRVRLLPLPGALALVVLVTVLLMAIASLQGVPQFGNLLLDRRPPAPTPSSGGQTPGPSIGQGLPDLPLLAAIASVIAIVIAVVGLLLLGWLFWRVVRALWAARPLGRQEGGAVDVGQPAMASDDGVDAGAIRDAAVDAQQAIDEHRDPSDAIVAAWVELEQVSARAGRARAESETPGEFTVRILRRRPGMDADLETLLALYESVRFGGVSADEQARTAARRCLAAIEEGWR
ncbi:DUF4129 domain-containing protein [Microbacterium azadirachtae]|uniref:DUF4129 domain-containing protein n=1 Tax=Microbacterium azadirachtae TaxID=582680 RepID=UPI003F756A1A